MVGEQIEEWRDPSPVTSDDGGSSSNESTSYEEEVPTPPIEKKTKIRTILLRRIVILQHKILAPQHGIKQMMRNA